MQTRQINIKEYHYNLPEERIAQFPLEKRDRSKLLVYKDKKISDSSFYKIADHLPGNSLMIMNETRVVRARLHFKKSTGALIEIFCLEPVEPVREIQQSFIEKSGVVWKCLIGNAKRWKEGTLEADLGNGIHLFAEKLIHEGDHFLVRFSWTPMDLSLSEILLSFGKIPLPPYIQREASEQDLVTYQTVYARNEGSVAAPTAGLHFTPEVLQEIQNKNIQTKKVTLHVGAGTFRPVTSSSLEGHQMHTEQIFISIETIEELLKYIDKPTILVGTTTTRLIESLYWHGVKILLGKSHGTILDVRQWDPYEINGAKDIAKDEALRAVLNVMQSTGISHLQGNTSLMIAPGYQYRFADILITNFHQPGSTLLLLIAAFLGDDWRRIYKHALGHEYRFLSYGDSCLFFRS